MASPKEELLNAIQQSGVTRAEAEHAVNRCLMSMTGHALGTYAGGGLLAYFMNMTPASALGYGTAALAGGAAYALAKAPACQEVRTAVTYWNRALF